MTLKSKFLALGLATALAFSPAGSALQTFGVHTSLTAHAANTISSYDDLVSACKKGGTYTITKDIKVTKPIAVSAKVVLTNKSEDNIIYCASEMAYIFKISGNDAKLTLGSSTADENRVVIRGGSGDTPYTTSAVIVSDDGSTLVMNRVHIYRSNNSAIRVKGRSVAYLKGNTGTGQNDNSINGIKPNKNYYGAVLVCENSTFNMSGGYIGTKNSGCTAGGVTVKSGSEFNMSGGKICYNTGGAGNPDVNQNGDAVCTGYGGGVYNAGTFNMKGGTISDNFSIQGGAVYNTGTFNMTSGKITGNSASSKGNGVYLASGGKMNVSGDCLIEATETNVNDVVLQSDTSKLNITGPLSKTPAMKVTLAKNTVGTTIATCTNGVDATTACNALDVTNKGDCVIAASDSKIILSKYFNLNYDYDGDGTAENSQKLLLSAPFTVPAMTDIPTKTGYSLSPDGLTGSDGNVYVYGNQYNMAKDLTLTGKWTPKTYTVNYDMNGGVGNIPSVSAKFDTGFTVEYTNLPTKDGYTFIGWTDSKADADAKKPIYVSAQPVQYKYESDVTLYAVWAARGVTITYNTDGGTAIASTVGDFETKPKVTSEKPLKEGYIFQGWYDENGNKVAAGNTITSDTTLKAKWSDASVTWNVQFVKASNTGIKLYSDVNTDIAYSTKSKKAVTLQVAGTRTTSEGTENASIEYQIVKKGNELVMSNSAWKGAANGKITIKNTKAARLYIRATVNGFSTIYKTSGFVVDSSAPTVKGIKNNKTYKKAVTIKVTDSVSGVKSIKLNGKTIKSGKKVKKNGAYKLVVKDKYGHSKTVRFCINK